MPGLDEYARGLLGGFQPAGGLPMASGSAPPSVMYDPTLDGRVAPQSQQSNALVAGLKSGFYEGVGDLSSAGQAVASTVGLPAFADSLKRFAAAQQTNAAAVGRPDLENAPWYSPTATLYRIAKGVPQIGAGLGAALLAPEGAGALAVGGLAAGATYPFLVGHNVQALERENGGQLPEGGVGTAAAYALPEAAVGALPIGHLESILSKGVAGSLAHRIVAGGAANAALGGVSSAVNTALEQQMTNPDTPVVDRAAAIKDSFLTGAVQGGVLGGGLAALRRTPSLRPDASTSDIDAATAQLNEALQPTRSDGQGELPGFGPRPAPEQPAPPPEAPAQPETAPTEVQNEMFSPVETGERAQAVAKARDLFVNEFSIPKTADISSFDAATPAEAVNWVRDQVTAHDAADKAVPAWLRKAGEAVGVLDSAGKDRDLAGEIADAQAQREELLAKASKNRDNKQGVKYFEQAQQQAAEIKRLQGLIDTHAEADQLRQGPPPAEPRQLTYQPAEPEPATAGPTLFVDKAGVPAESLYEGDMRRQADATLPRKQVPERLQSYWDLMQTVVDEGDTATKERARNAQQMLQSDARGAAQYAGLIARQFAESQRPRVQAERPGAPQPRLLTYQPEERPPLFVEPSGRTAESLYEAQARQQAEATLPRNQVAPELRDHWDAMDAVVQHGPPELAVKARAVQKQLESGSPSGAMNAGRVAKAFSDLTRPTVQTERSGGAQNAVQEPSTAGVDVRKPAANGEAVAGRNAQRTAAAAPGPTLEQAAASEAPSAAAQAVIKGIRGKRPTVEPTPGNLIDNDNAPAPAPAAKQAVNASRPFTAEDLDALNAQQAKMRAPAAKPQPTVTPAPPAASPALVEAQAALDRVNKQIKAGTLKGEEARQAQRYWQNAVKNGGETPTITSGPRSQADVDLEHIVSQGGTGTHALDYLRQYSADPATRELAGRLQDLGVNPKIEMASPDGIAFDNPRAKAGTVAASYSPRLDRVNVYDRAGMGQSVLHEMVHAATQKALATGGAAAREINRLYEAVKARSPGDDAYGLTNAREFVAEAFTNPQFRDFLRGQRVSTGSVFGDAWQGLKNIIAKVIGAPERVRTLLDQTLESGSKLMNENQRAATVPDINDRSVELARVADTEREGWLRRAATTVMPKEARAQAFKKVLYFATKNDIVENLGKNIPALKEYGAADAMHTQVGAAHSTTYMTALEPLRQLEARVGQKLARQFQQDYQTLGQLQANERGWAANPQLHEHPRASELRPLLDGIANRFNSTYRQKGILPVYRDLRALGVMDNAAHLYRGLAQHVTELHPGKVQVGDDPVLAFANGDKRTTVDGAVHYMAALRDLVQKVQDYVSPLRAEAQALPKGDQRRRSIESQIGDLESHLRYTQSEMQAMAQAPYTPNRRFGNYFVATHLAKDGEAGVHPRALAALRQALDDAGFHDVGINQHIENPTVFMRTDTVDKAQQLRNIVDKLGERGMLDREGETTSGELSDLKHLGKIAPSWVRGLIEKVAASGDFATNDQKQMVSDQMKQVLLEVMPQRSLVRLARTDAQGFSTNLYRSFAQRAQISANAIAHMTTAPMLDKALGNLKAHVDSLSARSDVAAQAQAQSVYNEISERLANRQIMPTHSYLDTARTFVHTWFLGVSPAYFALELSQIPTFVVPAMARTHGFAASYRAVAKTLPMTLKVAKAVMNSDLGRYAIMTPEGLRAQGIPPAIADFLVRTNNRGWFENSATRQLGMYGDGRMSTAQKLMHWANIASLYTEFASHVNTALAVRELHNARPDARGLDAFVDDVMGRGQWHWGPGETARAFGKQGFAGKYTPNIVQFSSWQAKAIGRLYTDLHDVFSKNATPTERKQAATFLLGHLATVGVLSGALGLPMAQTVMGLGSKLANTLTGSDDWDLENGFRGFLTNMFGKEWGDAIARGAPHLVGADLGEMGDAGLVPFGRFLADQRKWEDAAKDWSWHSIGSSFGLAANIYKGFRDFAMGDTLNGMKELMPTSLKNPFEAYLMSQHGYENRAGVKSPIQPSSADVALKATGIEPASAVQNEDLQMQAERTRDNREYVNSYLRGNLTRAAAHGDQTGLNNAVQEMIAYARAHPGLKLNPGAIVAQQARQSALAQTRGMPAGIGLRDLTAQQRLAPYYIPGR